MLLCVHVCVGGRISALLKPKNRFLKRIKKMYRCMFEDEDIKTRRIMIYIYELYMYYYIS